MIQYDKLKGSGFTLICADVGYFNGEPDLTQYDIDNMFEEIIEILSKYNFMIDMVGENEEIMRMQGRIMISKYFNILDKLYLDEQNNNKLTG